MKDTILGISVFVIIVAIGAACLISVPTTHLTKVSSALRCYPDDSGVCF